MSIKVLIFEDENLSAEHLVNLIHRYDRTIVPLGIIESVRQGITWLNTHTEPDLLIMDIQLSDGSCFDLFKQVKTECPVIFTTAFNEYAIQAFKVNSIDYLLKPVDFDDLRHAIEKYRKQRQVGGTGNELLYQQLYSQLLKDNQYKKRLLIKIGEQLKQVNVSDIAFFQYDTGMCWVVTGNKNRYPVDYSLDELENCLDPATFFRINRKIIINPGCIEKIHTYFNNRLKLQLRPDPQTEVLVSRERVQEFKNWLNS